MTWLLGVGAAVLGFMVGWFMGVMSSAGPAPVRTAVYARPWTALPSGIMCGYGGGLSGYVTVVEGRSFWWINRNDKTLVAGYAESLDAAKKQADIEARWLVA